MLPLGKFFCVEKIQNGIFSTSPDVFSVITIAMQYFKHPWVIKILLLVFLRNIISAFQSYQVI